jgi:acetyltransferase EpsM
MNQGPVCIYGAGGHASVVVETLHVNQREIAMYFDDDRSVVDRSNGQYQPGLKLAGELNFNLPDLPFLLAIGNNRVRAKLASRLSTQFTTAIHPSAVVASNVTVGDGSVIFAQAVLQPNSQVGEHAIINTSAGIDHDCHISNFAHISPNATLCGNVRVGEGSHIGAGATIIEGIRVGRWSTVGAGAVVIRDVPDFTTVVGCPARLLRTSNPSAQKRQLALIGGGGFGREIAGCLAEEIDRGVLSNCQFAGVVDDNPNCESATCGSGIEYLGTIQEVASRRDLEFAITVGSTTLLAKIRAQLRAANSRLFTYIHSTARVAHDATVGQGSIIAPQVIVNAGAVIGDCCVVNLFSNVGHGARIGTGSVLSPFCAISGDVTLGESCFLGTRATVFPGVHVGDWCVVDAHCCVRKSIDAHRMVAQRSPYVNVENRLGKQS